MPKFPRNKRPQICTNFGILFLLEWKFQKTKKTCNYSIWTRRPIYNCSRISRASRASLIPINRPLAFEEKHTQTLRKNQRLHQEGGSL
jgi:hypothetical protein